MRDERGKRRHARATCDSPETPNRAIEIKSGAKGRELIELVVHESLHGAAWHINEELVAEFADDVAKILTHPEIWSRIAPHVTNEQGAKNGD